MKAGFGGEIVGESSQTESLQGKVRETVGEGKAPWLMRLLPTVGITRESLSLLPILLPRSSNCSTTLPSAFRDWVKRAERPVRVVAASSRGKWGILGWGGGAVKSRGCRRWTLDPAAR